MAETPEEQDSIATAPSAEVSPAGIALALGKSRHGAPLPPETAAFLLKQTELVDLQKEHLHEQRELVLSRLRWGRFSDRIKALLQVLTAVVGLLIAAGVGWMAWQAHEDRSLIVEAFSVPPDLAQQGLSGQAFASLLLDRLAEMDSKAPSVRAANSYTANWGEDAKVEIPETGVSIGELDRFLRRSLGQQTYVSGEVIRTAGGLTVSVRATGQPGVSVTGSDTDLDGVVRKAAEAVYGQTQPYRYSKYLEFQGRIDEALAVTRQLTQSTASPHERAWAFAQLEDLLQARGDLVGAAVAGRQAVRLNPDMALGYSNLADAEQFLGHDGAAVQAYARGLVVTPRSMSQMSPQAQVLITDRLAGPRYDLLGDVDDAEITWSHYLVRQDFQGYLKLIPALRSRAFSLAHDPSAARALRLQGVLSTDVALLGHLDLLQSPLMPEYEEAAAAEDWPRALGLLDGSISATQSMGPMGQVTRERFLLARRAFVLATLGRLPEAAAEIAATPLDCYICLRVRGQVAAAQGDRAGAARWFAQAVRQSPPLPQAEAEWARMLLDGGDNDGAIAELAQAHIKSPHFPDALELWGEALMRKGDLKAAIAKFTEADAHAPRWGRNHLRWGEALVRAGRPGEARAQFERANGMDLNADDRVALTALLLKTRA